MVFSYYARLSARNQAIYRDSDRVTALRLPRPEQLTPLVATLQRALDGENRRAVALAAQTLSDALLEALGVTPLKVKVLAVRPAGRWGELHGLYTSGEEAPAEIRLWMRTVRHKQVVAFRTFLRTLLHELCHHLDYRHLKLKDSYHTEGFFRRESSLFRQIAPGLAGPRKGRAEKNKASGAAEPRARDARAPAVTSPRSPRKPPAKAEHPSPAAGEQRRLPFDSDGDN